MTNPDGNPTSAGSSGGMATGGAFGYMAPLIGAGAQIYDTYQSNKTARENTDKTIAANREEALLAYQRSIAMWRMQNQYNSPQAQMDRFKAAGLNPHLIYGQGNSGNASGTPQYNPPNIQYQYQAPRYGAALQSILPTLMEVGSWMQSMRLGETEIQKRKQSIAESQTSVERTRQMIDQAIKMNPKLLEIADNKLSLFPYQRDTQGYLRDQAHHKLFEMEQDFRQKFGEDLFKDPAYSAWTNPGNAQIGGTKRLEYIKQEAEARLKQAQASWTDFDITNPQMLMQAAMGILGNMAGQTLRLSTGRVNQSSRSGSPKTVKTFYNEKGRRRSQVVDY